MSDNGREQTETQDTTQNKVHEKSQATRSNKQNEARAFDWITARSSCSLPKVFATLRSQIEQDVKTRNSLRPSYAPYEFSVGEDTEEIRVRLTAKEIEKSVTFSLVEHAIVVRGDEGNRLFEITPTFDDCGKCRLKVNGEEREFWQVRRMALEDLMFRGL
jgi:hypothetical protein